MNIYTSLDSLPTDITTVASVGNFDGVHIGHQALIRAVVQRASQLKGSPAIVTFDPHPSLILPHVAKGVRDILTPLSVKLQIMQQLGIETAVVLPFTPQLASMSPREFVQKILVGALGVQELHEGTDFRFGKGGIADISQLAKLGCEFGFEVKAHSPVLYAGERISSSRIRELVSQGNLDLANRLLALPVDASDASNVARSSL